MRKYLNVISLRWVTAAAIFFVSLLTWGCSPAVTERVIYKDVKMPVPVPCVVDMPVKPAADGNAAETNLKILKYARELESILRKCRAVPAGKA